MKFPQKKKDSFVFNITAEVSYPSFSAVIMVPFFNRSILTEHGVEQRKKPFCLIFMPLTFQINEISCDVPLIIEEHPAKKATSVHKKHFFIYSISCSKENRLYFKAVGD